MNKKIICFSLILCFILFISQICFATDIVMNLADNSVSNNLNNINETALNSIENTGNSNTNSEYIPITSTTDYEDEAELSITNMINIVLISVGIVIILLGIAIIIKLK